MSGAGRWWIAPGGRANGGALIIRDADDRPVATMWLREDAYQLAGVAAAAPTLLEACERLLSWVLYDHEFPDGTCGGATKDVELARAAIAAARGGK